MSGALHQVRPREVAKVALGLGFEFRRQSGSHAIYKRRADGKRVVISIHSGVVKPGTLHAIIRDMGIGPEEFLRLVK